MGCALSRAKGKSGSKAAHSKGIAGLNDAQVRAIGEFVKTRKSVPKAPSEVSPQTEYDLAIDRDKTALQCK